MTEGATSGQREFHCSHCNGKIFIPKDLPATTAPCPHCGKSITSPAPGAATDSVQHVFAEVKLPVAAPRTPAPAPASTPAPASVPAQPLAPGKSPFPVEPVPAPTQAKPADVSAERSRYGPPPTAPAGPVDRSAVAAFDSISIKDILPPAQPGAATISTPATASTPAAAAGSGFPGAAASPAVPVKAAEPIPAPASVPSPYVVPGREEPGSILEGVSQKPEKKKGGSLKAPVLVMLTLLVAAGGVVVYFSRSKHFVPPPVTVDPVRQAKMKEEDFAKGGWALEAKSILSKFLSASTVEKKAAFVLNAKELQPEMTAFYATHPLSDADSPVDAFGPFPLGDSDRERGIYMMTYEQPEQVKFKEMFVPLAPLELQNGLVEPDLLMSAAASASNFTSESVKIQVLFKTTPEGLKLDWPTFVQTKYRTLRHFTDLPQAGKSGVFRVLIQEDVPDKGRVTQGMRSYKVFDPIHTEDYARVNVAVDSDLGRSLSGINWIGIKNTKAEWRTATVELEWTRDQVPQLTLKHFICWEFLGLGGQAAPSK